MANFEAFHQVISSSINLLFLKSSVCNFFSQSDSKKTFINEDFRLSKPQADPKVPEYEVG